MFIFVADGDGCGQILGDTRLLRFRIAHAVQLLDHTGQLNQNVGFADKARGSNY